MLTIYKRKNPLADILETWDNVFDYWLQDEKEKNTFGRKTFDEKTQETELKYPLPGVSKEEILVFVEGKKLTIEVNPSKDTKSYFNSSFKEVYEDERYDMDKTKISLNDGVLTVRIPKKETEKTKKRKIDF